MKRTLLIGALAAACAAPLGAQVVRTSRAAVLTDGAAGARTADDPKSDEILVWVMESKGKGWSAGKKARAAMKSVEGIDRMFLSGTVATFTMKDGQQPDAKALMEAVEKNQLEFVSLSMRKSQRAQAAWICKTPKLTWSETAAKVRATLIEGLDVQDVFVGTEIVFHLSDAKGSVDGEKLKKLLDEHEVKFEDLERDDDYILWGPNSVGPEPGGP